MSPAEAFNAVINFFQQGGPFMYPILLMLALGLSIAVERWLFLSASAEAQNKTLKKVMPLLSLGRFEEALERSRAEDSPVARVLAAGLQRRHSSRRREDVEMAMEESLMEVMPRFEKRTHYLATLANIATLLGLLGTIIGLIQAFTALGQSGAEEKAAILSSSISVAMNTTAFGLMVAIPLLLIHSWLQARTTELTDALEMSAVRLLNTVSEADAGAPPPAADARPEPAAQPAKQTAAQASTRTGAAAKPAAARFTPARPREK